MKTTKFQPAVQAAAALAIALAGAFAAVPARAEAGADPAPSTAAPSPSVAPSVSAAGLAEAIRRDLGMTLEEFNAAGEQARRAADAVPSLRGLPGYAGISLKDGKIAVDGGGAELQARVDQLNRVAPADFVLVAPAPGTPGSMLSTPGSVPSESASDAPAAPSAAELVASSTEQLFQAYVQDVGPAGLKAVAYSDGHFVIRTGGTTTLEAGLPTVPGTPAAPATDARPSMAPTAAPGKISPAEFVARYTNVQLEQGVQIKTEEDLYGGEGYFVDQSAICSAGFGVFSPDGLPGLLTAGHCAEDGTARVAETEQPSGSKAAGATIGARAGLLGTFGFSQFGGTNNSKVAADGANIGTDIALLQTIRPGLSIQPAATQWDNPANPGPTAVQIVGTTQPLLNLPVCRSGRTTGWKCGTVDSIGIWSLPGRNSLPPDYDNDLRAVRAFDSKSVTSGGGDSGGPWISGNFAVGTHSGAQSDKEGNQVRAIAATLEDALGQIPGGVQLQLFLNQPGLVTPANATFTAGTPITGRVPAAPASAIAANSKVRITVAGQPPLEVPVDAAGNWSFAAPLAAGRLQFSAETVNGFSRSGAAALSLSVSDLAAPVITGPSEGAELTAVGSIDGTGTPGLSVLLSGDITASAVVGPDGKWSVPLSGQAVYGKVSVTAVQTAAHHEDSPSATQSFTVIPPAPAISGISDGLRFSQDGLP